MREEKEVENPKLTTNEISVALWKVTELAILVLAVARIVKVGKLLQRDEVTVIS